MRSLLLLLSLGTSALVQAQLTVHTVQVTTNDLVYDAVTNRIYASIPSSNGSNGNSIGTINPATYTLQNTVFIGSEPTVLAISDNGQYIYSGFNGTSTVRRFDVAAQTAGLQFSLGSDSSTGSYYVEDIEVMPGAPTTIAVARRNNGFSPKHEGVVIFDNNVMRPTITPDHTGSNRIEFTSATSLIGYNNETTEYGIRRMAVNSGGVSVVSVTQSILSGFNLDFYYRDNTMYAFNGKVVDINTAPFVSGQFTNASGPVVYDSYYNKVAFASYDFSGNITFKRYDPNTFLLLDSLPISQAFGSVKNIITCGNGCYAFNTTDNKVIIIKDSTLGVTDVAETNKISLYPNPASNYVNIQSEVAITDIAIFDLHGRKVYQGVNHTDNISLVGLNAGIYIVRLSDFNGNTTTKKIVKQ